MSQIVSAEPWAANNSQMPQYPHNPYQGYYGVLPSLQWPNKDTGIEDGTLYLPPTPGVGVPLPNLMMPNVQIPSDQPSISNSYGYGSNIPTLSYPPHQFAVPQSNMPIPHFASVNSTGGGNYDSECHAGISSDGFGNYGNVQNVPNSVSWMEYQAPFAGEGQTNRESMTANGQNVWQYPSLNANIPTAQAEASISAYGGPVNGYYPDFATNGLGNVEEASVNGGNGHGIPCYGSHAASGNYADLHPQPSNSAACLRSETIEESPYFYNPLERW